MSNTAQRNFGAGELAPALHARADVALCRAGLRTCRNALVMKTGGLQSRPGTLYKGATKGNTWARLIPCVFDDDQNYLLEFGNGTLRFWKDGTQITATVTGAWADTTAYTAGIVVSHSGTNYVCLQDHTSATANDRPNDGTNRADYWYALTGTIYELPTPWTTQAIMRKVQTQVSAGVMRFAYNGTSRRKLTRVSNNVWYFSVVTASSAALAAPTGLAWTGSSSSSGVKFQVTAYDSLNALESLPSATFECAETLATLASSGETLTWNAVTGATVYRVYRADENTGGTFGLVMGTTGLGYGEDGSLAADVSTTPPSAASGSFSDPATYPGVIGAYQQRILLAGTTGTPASVRTSRTGAPDDFTISNPLTDSDAVSWTMVGERVIRPRHFLEVAKRLIQFANIGEYVIEGDESGILTPGAVNPRELSANGAAVSPSPLKVNTTALYVQERGGIVRDVTADDASSDVSVTASHLLTGYTIPEWCYQQTPHSVVWAVRSDGVLLSLTYQREAGILAWAKHDTDGTFESIAVVPESGEDAVYAIVNRTINGSTVRYLERFASRSGTATTLVCMDCAVTYTGGSISTMTGLSHLNGEAVSIVADGVVLASPNNPAYTTRTVSGGSVAMGGSGTTVHAGLPFTVDVRTLDLDTAGGKSVKEGGINVKRVGVWVEETGAVWVGQQPPVTDHTLTGLFQHPMKDEEGQPIAAGSRKTGYGEVPIAGRWSPGGSIFLRHVDPTALTLLATIPFFEAGRS